MAPFSIYGEENIPLKDRAAKAAYMRKYYHQNKHKFNVRYRENRALLVSYKKTCRCADCGETDFRVLEFHHRDPSTKTRAITKMMGGYTWQRIQEEIAKCDVLCANCHARRHYNEKAASTHAS